MSTPVQTPPPVNLATTADLQAMRRPPLFAIAIDGPKDKPNGHLLVEVIQQSSARNRFDCRVIRVLEATGRTATPGDLFTADAMHLFFHWV
jgi:hypothetical protein